MKDIIEPEKADQELVIPEDEDIVELTGVIEDSAESGDEIVELTDIAEAPGPESVEPMERIDEEREAEAIDLTDIVEEDDMIEASPTVSSEQVDAAIERVVRDMLSEKIDSILVQVIEKEVSREIERLKGFLMDEQVNKE
jgi:hypothetical protein